MDQPATARTLSQAEARPCEEKTPMRIALLTLVVALTTSPVLAYRRYSTKYVPEENQAKAARAGIWADEFVPPWAWRRGQRLD